MNLMPERCRRHPYQSVPCFFCAKLRSLYKGSDVERFRVSAVLEFIEKHSRIQTVMEAQNVFVELRVDDGSIRYAIQKLNELVWRLAPYPDFVPEQRKVAACARDFLEEMIGANKHVKTNDA